jgi:hypothetical protein
MYIILYKESCLLILNKKHVYTFEQTGINKNAPLSAGHLPFKDFLFT